MPGSPLLEIFRRGEAARDIRLLAARGALAPRAGEQLELLVFLLDDADAEVRQVADETIRRIPAQAIAGFLARPDVPVGLREYFGDRGIFPADVPSSSEEAPLIESESDGDLATEDDGDPETAVQKLAKMSLTERLKAAMKGTREMRAILVRDPNKMIAAAVLSSPKLTEQEVEAIARMPNVSEDVLRLIGSQRAWLKRYSIVVALTRNSKTPLALSMNLMARLAERDLQLLSVDRNVPDPLRIAARKRLLGVKR
jgi:hypothetical protein